MLPATGVRILNNIEFAQHYRRNGLVLVLVLELVLDLELVLELELLLVLVLQ